MMRVAYATSAAWFHTQIYFTYIYNKFFSLMCYVIGVIARYHLQLILQNSLRTYQRWRKITAWAALTCWKVIKTFSIFSEQQQYVNTKKKTSRRVDEVKGPINGASYNVHMHVQLDKLPHCHAKRSKCTWAIYIMLDVAVGVVAAFELIFIGFAVGNRSGWWWKIKQCKP